MAGASSRVILAALAVASFAVAQPALAADSGGQGRASQTRAQPSSASVSGASSVPQGGTWGNAELVPGTAALDGGDWAGGGALSCTSPGDCAAAGFYSTSQPVEYGFVASQANGSWGKAAPEAGISGIGSGAITFASMSCASAASCTAGGSFYGSYSTDYDTTDGFVMSESCGRWGRAEELSDLGLAADTDVQVTSVSCPAAGDYVAAGSYQDSSGYTPFVVEETNGARGDAQQLAGTDGTDSAPLVACVSAGNCIVTEGDSVSAETGGIWEAAQGLPAGFTATALSCAPAATAPPTART